MNGKDKIKTVLDYLINIRYFSTVVSKETRKNLDKNDISCGESLYLIILNEYSNGLTMSELSNLMKVDKSLTTRNVKSLLNKEYVYKDTENLNSRNYKVKLTDKGIKKVNIINDVLIEQYDEFTNKFTKDELKVIEEAFTILMNKTNKEI